MPKRKNTSIKDYKLKSGKKRYMFQIYLGTNSNGKPIITRRRVLNPMLKQKPYSIKCHKLNQIVL